MVYANRSRFSVFSFHWAAAEPNDYVPFLAATLAMGRGVDESISSPYMSAPFELGGPDSMPTPYADISYTLNNLTSAATELDVPAYTPPAPIVSAPNAQNQVMVALGGAYQVQPSGSGSYATVTLYSSVVGSGTELAQNLYNDVTPANTAVYWTGLAISYTDTVTLTLSNNTLTGPLGSAPWNDGLFQQLEPSTIGKLDSGDGYVPGS